MERLLAHYVPNMSFDIPSLRKAVGELQRDQHEPSISEEPPTQAEADDLDDLAIDEESFSIRAFPDNTTREYCVIVSRVAKDQLLFWLTSKLQSTQENFHI